MTGRPGKETLSSRILGAIRAEILSGELAPGAKINLDRLREVHGVSISPLREAVARLAGERLVIFEDQRGYRVAPVSAADLDEVTGLRAAFDAMALEAAIAAGDLDWESDVMRALYRLNRTDRAAASGDWHAALAAFHRALIRGCGMPHLLAFCEVLANLHDRYRRLVPEEAGTAPRTDFAALAEAATRRDAPRAAALLRADVMATGAALRAGMVAQARPGA